MVKEKLSEGVMRPLVAADKTIIDKILPKIVAEGWTARKVERYFSSSKKPSSAKVLKEEKYRAEAEKLSSKYHAVVKISGRSLTFKCKTKTELEKLLEKLQ